MLPDLVLLYNCVQSVCVSLCVRVSLCVCVEILKGALSGLRQFLATKSPLKMMKNASFSRYLNFCLDFLAM